MGGLARISGITAAEKTRCCRGAKLKFELLPVAYQRVQELAHTRRVHPNAPYVAIR